MLSQLVSQHPMQVQRSEHIDIVPGVQEVWGCACMHMRTGRGATHVDRPWILDRHSTEWNCSAHNSCVPIPWHRSIDIGLCSWIHDLSDAAHMSIDRTNEFKCTFCAISIVPVMF
jgi:hypothetical protein